MLYTPKWTWSAGLQYDFEAVSKAAYIRGDYQYQDVSFRTFGPPTNAFTPDTYKVSANALLSMRAGVALTRSADASLFVNNLLNTQTEIYRDGGRTGARNNPLFTAATFRPREIGVTVTFRH